MTAPEAEAAPRGILGILSVCNFVIGMGAFALVGMIEPLADGLDAPVSAVGGLLTAYAVALAVGSPVLVALTGRVGRRRVLAAGLGVVALFSALAALAPSLAALYPIRVVTALGAGLVTPVSLAIAAGLAPPEGRGRAMASVFLGVTLAQVAGVPVGSWLAYTLGWQSVFWLIAALALPCLWLVWTRVPAGLKSPPVALSDLGRVLRDPVPVVTVGFTILFLASIYVVFTLLPPLLSGSMGFGRDGIALALFLFGAGAPLGNLIGGAMADRLGPSLSLTLICAGQVLCLPLFAVLPVPVAALYAFVFLWSVIGWAFSPSQQVRLVSLNPALAPVLMSLHAASIYVGIALGSAVSAAVARGPGLWALGPVAACVMVLALGALWLSVRAARRRVVPSPAP